MARGDERITDGSRLRLALILVVLLLGAVVAVGLTPVFDSQVVHDQTALSKVELGFPVPWMRQDQSSDDRQLPWKARLVRPQDYPFAVEPAGLAIDLGAAVGLEALVAGGILLVLRRRHLLD
ncbi:MAG: hypothetical protein ACJ72E_13285 [Marmoricola sp.]